MVHKKIQSCCAWSGVLAIVLFFSGLAIFARFVPPLSPMLTQDQIVAIYQQNSNGIRICGMLMMIGGLFVAPFTAVISAHVRRMEGEVPLLTYAQLSAGTTGIMAFFLPGFFFCVAAFRPDGPPEITYFMNDVSWLAALITWAPASMQCTIVGIAILADRSRQPIFPRWVAYYNLFAALSFVADAFPPFFKSGPFAWSGIFPFWMDGATFSTWFVIMLIVLLKAINQQENATLSQQANAVTGIRNEAVRI